MIKKFKFSKIIKTVPLVYDPGQGHQDLGGGEATVRIQHQEFPDDVDGVTGYSVIPEIGDNISNFTSRTIFTCLCHTDKSEVLFKVDIARFTNVTPISGVYNCHDEKMKNKCGNNFVVWSIE